MTWRISIRLTMAVVAIILVTMPACSRKNPSQNAEREPTKTGGSATIPGMGGGNPGESQSNGPANASAQPDAPIDVNATYGQPPMTAEEAALAKKVKEAILADPRVTSKRIYVGVTHSWNGTPGKDPQITLAGSVASEDEKTAAVNDVIKMEGEGWTVGNSLHIEAQSGKAPDALGSWSEPPASEKPNIPLCPGLTIVTAIASGGDYESIKTVESVEVKQMRLKYSSESNRPWWEVPPARRNCEAGTPGCSITEFLTHRTVLTSDLESAHNYDQIFVTDKKASDTLPGATAIGTSAAVLRELKVKGKSKLGLCTFAEDMAGVDEHEITGTWRFRPTPAGCEGFTPLDLKRVGDAPVPVRVLLNGAAVDLPALQVSGLHGPNKFSDRSEFFFLDDEQNPLTLKFRLGIGVRPALDPDTRQKCEAAKTQGSISLGGDDPPSCDLPEGGDRDVLTVTKITTRCELPHSVANSGAGGAEDNGVNALEKSLAETGKVDIYSIYFSFNSDKLRDESMPTLKDIAEVMRRHPEWKLQVNGHTDGIGGDEFNLDLSKRRAAAVKTALVKQLGVNIGRLATAGYGKSQPKDTNDTLEGRARNRRVELMKIS